MLHSAVTCKLQVIYKLKQEKGNVRSSMANAVVTHTGQPKVSAAPGTGTFVAVFFAVWFALVLVLGARGAFVAAADAPPLGLLIGLVAPLSLFLVGYRTIPALRE